MDSQGLRTRQIDHSTDKMIRIDIKVKEDLGIGPFGSGAFSRWRGRAARVTGTVDPRFQSVVPLFVRNFKQRLELGAQLCVYADGCRVVDLTGWSAHRSTASYDGNTLQCVFSAGKNIESFCVALLVERGLLAYESPIAKYWPAFGQHGKQGVTVADLMRHDAGLSFLSSPGAGGDPSRDFKITPEDVKNRAVAGKIEKSARWPIDPSNPSGQGRVYHAHTRGLILSELIHRVDPQERYLQQFFDEEFAKPLQIDVFAGQSPALQQQHTFADMKQMHLGYNVAVNILPALLGVGDPTVKKLVTVLGSKSNPLNRTPFTGNGSPPSPKFNNTELGRSLDLSSSGVQASARGLAKLHAALANRGTVDGVTVFSPRTASSLLDNVVVAHDSGLHLQAGFSQGGLCQLQHIAPHFHGYMGWAGWGGSLAAVHPTTNIAIAYTVNAMSNSIIGDARTAHLLPHLAAIPRDAAPLTLA